ncbi:MAG TPA: 50S ribosomal protein L29 [Gammaproteobacteria bacterium]|jgi:large subunit ribosomal protein L29|nr:50S ribosomal protein L29 [Gammaproteobacteria bacterium]
MKAAEIRAKEDAELAEELVRLRREQFNLRMQAATGQGARPDQFGKVRRDVARIKTILRERKLAAKEQA